MALLRRRGLYESGRVLYLPVDGITPNPAQPRRSFEPEGLKELADSIREHGILQPLSVRRTPGGYELISGERRLRAARQAGLTEVPCILVHADGERSSVLALVENLQRRDLDFLEEAAALAQLIRTHGLSQEEAARRLGKSQSAVANKLRLLRLSPACGELLRKYELTERHARALLRLESDPELQWAAAQHIVDAQLTVSLTEQYVESLLNAPAPPVKRRPTTYIIKDVRIFLNTIQRGVSIMKSAGVEANCDQQDTPDAILLTIRIPKQSRSVGSS